MIIVSQKEVPLEYTEELSLIVLFKEEVKWSFPIMPPLVLQTTLFSRMALHDSQWKASPLAGQVDRQWTGAKNGGGGENEFKVSPFGTAEGPKFGSWF